MQKDQLITLLNAARGQTLSLDVSTLGLGEAATFAKRFLGTSQIEIKSAQIQEITATGTSTLGNVADAGSSLLFSLGADGQSVNGCEFSIGLPHARLSTSYLEFDGTTLVNLGLTQFQWVLALHADASLQGAFLQAEFAVNGKSITLRAPLATPDDSDAAMQARANDGLAFTADTTALGINLTNLAGLTFGAKTWALAGLAGSLPLAASLTLQGLQLYVAEGAIIYARVIVHSAQGMPVLPGKFEFQELVLALTSFDIEHFSQPSVYVATRMQVFGHDIDMSMRLPEMIFEGDLFEEQPLALKPIVSQVLPGALDWLPNDFALSGLRAAFDWNAKSFAVDATLAKLWKVDFGTHHFEFTALEVLLTGPTAPTFEVIGQLTLGSLPLYLRAKQPQSATDGWEFEFRTGSSEPVSLTAIADELFKSVGVALPTQLPDLALENFRFVANSGSKAFEISGTASAATLNFGHNDHILQVDVLVTSVYDKATQKRNFAGFINGQLAVGTATLSLEFDFAVDHLIKGRWQQSGNESLTLKDVVAALGIAGDMPSSLDQINLSLKDVVFETDLSQGKFTLSADSLHHGAAFFVASNAAGKWDCVFGVEMQASALPGDSAGVVASVSNAVHMTGFCALYSTTNDDSFALPTLPALPGSSAVPFPVLGGMRFKLRPGAYIATVVDLGASSGTAAKNAHGLVGATTLFMQAEILQPFKNSAFAVDLASSVKLLGAGKSSIVLTDPAFKIIFSPFSFALQGEALVPMGANTVDATGRILVGDTEATCAFSVAAKDSAGNPAPLMSPVGFKGVQIDEVGLEMGVVFEPPGVELGIEGKFHVIGQAVNANSICTVLDLEGEVPNPLALSCHVDTIDIKTLVTAVTGQAPTGIPAFISSIQARDLSIYWVENDVMLPDGTMARKGFGFNGFISVAGLTAHAKLDVSQAQGVTGDAELSPINIKDVLKLTGDGKGVTVKQQEVSGVWQAASGDAASRNLPTREVPVIEPGGANLAFSSQSAPYLHASMCVDLFDIARARILVDISDSGFEFDLDYALANAVRLTLHVKLNDHTAFDASAQFTVDLDAHIGPIKILGIDLGTIHLQAGFAADLDLHVDTQSFKMGVAGSFWFEGVKLSMPKLTIDVAFASLGELPAKIVEQITDHAEEIFEDLYDLAKQALEAVAKEVEKIAEEAADEVKKLADAAAAEAEKIADEAKKVAEAVGQDIAKAAEEVADVAAEAEQIAADAAKEVAAIGEAAAADVKAAVDEVASIAKAGAEEVAKIGEAVAHEVAALADQAKAIGEAALHDVEAIGRAAEDAAKAVEHAAEEAANAIAHEAENIAAGIENAAKKVLDDIAEAAEKAAHWIEGAGKSVWHAISKY